MGDGDAGLKRRGSFHLPARGGERGGVGLHGIKEHGLALPRALGPGRLRGEGAPDKALQYKGRASPALPHGV